MAYLDDIVALAPDHIWKFDGAAFSDEVGTNVAIGTSITSQGAISEGVSNSAFMDNVNDRIQFVQEDNIDGLLSRKIICGWVRIDDIQLPPKNIYREGLAGNQFNLTMWAGNKLMLDIRQNGVTYQAYSDRALKPTRVYHLCAVFSGTAFENIFALYIDGVKQAVSNPATGTPSIASLTTRELGFFGARLTGETTQVGGVATVLNATVGCRHNYWVSFSDITLSESVIRTELFEKGALPGVSVTNQAGLDALSATSRPDEPLNIRIEDNGGDLSLLANNITHDPLASVHLQWMGSGTLTYVNTNGSDASIVSTPNGGTVTIVNPAVLTISPLVINTEVRVYDAGTMTELGGIEDSGTSFSVSIQSSTVDVVVHNIDYEYIRVDSIDMTSGDVDLPITQIFDRNYENP
jgi:hypothetical protein